MRQRGKMFPSGSEGRSDCSEPASAFSYKQLPVNPPRAFVALGYLKALLLRGSVGGAHRGSTGTWRQKRCSPAPSPGAFTHGFQRLLDMALLTSPGKLRHRRNSPATGTQGAGGETGLDEMGSCREV